MKNKLALVIIGLVLIITLASLTHKNNKQKEVSHVSTNTPCTVDPCIEITEPSGQHYRLNDFRFVSPAVDPRHCILFISLPDEGHREACGNYQLKWIGPDNMDQKHGTAIRV